MRKQPKQRSVGIQSADFTNAEFQPRIYKVGKKSGFRNLLQPSVTVVPEESREEIINSFLPREYHSRGVQAGTGGQSAEYLQGKHSIVENGRSKSATSKVMKITELGTSNPGTSRMVSGAYSSTSIVSQVNGIYLQRHEGSLAVVYGRGSKERVTSVASSTPHYFESQGARRLSNETVLLIEDYQSYDEANVARRQEPIANRGDGFFCCIRKPPEVHPQDVLTRPLPVHREGSDGSDNEIVCRICHEGEDVEPLIQPCLCRGSVGSVHAGCLKVWLEQSNSSRCELCKYPYAIRQTKKYSRCYSIRVFYKTVIDRRSMAYDVTSFVIITPLTLVGVVMCIQASLNTTSASEANSFEMGYITKIGMVMLSGTIVIAYGVWFYTLISYHYKAWRRWYNSCYDVEVIPVRLTSEERLEAARRFSQEMRNRRVSSAQTSAIPTILHSPPTQSFYQRRMSVTSAPVPHRSQ